MRKKIIFYKRLLVEIIETLCSICLYLDYETHLSHNKYGLSMRSHFYVLKHSSEELREQWGLKEPIDKMRF